jgi:hydroxypyruvate isomerase
MEVIMSEIINLLAGQTEEVSNGIAWLSNDLKEVEQLIQLLADSQVLNENKSVHTMCSIMIEKLEKIEANDIHNINKNLVKLNSSVNDLMIESVNKRSSRSTKQTTKTRTRKTSEKRIVKMEDSVDKSVKQVNTETVTAIAK